MWSRVDPKHTQKYRQMCRYGGKVGEFSSESFDFPGEIGGLVLSGEESMK